MKESLDAIRAVLARTDLSYSEQLEAIHGWCLTALPSPRGGAWEEKRWGRTVRLHYSPDLEICRAEIVRGGHSSMHRHENKNNVFIVLAGRLVVQNQTLSLEYTITPSIAPMLVHANNWHRFIALDATTLIEVYSKAGEEAVEIGDIVRQDVGGVAKSNLDLFNLGCKTNWEVKDASG